MSQMAASPTHIRPGNIEIDPEANLAIYLYLRDGSKCLPPSPLSSPSPTSHNSFQSNSPSSATSPTSPMSSPMQLTLDRVMLMSLEQLDHLQERVCQMEISNYGLLTRIYGRFPATHQPFPTVVSSRMSCPDFPERGSSQHRHLLFSQYRNMLTIARDPTRSVSSVEPSTTRGAKALQDYQMQLLLLAEQRRKHLKRKSQEDSRQELYKPLKFEPTHLKDMRQNPRALTLDIDSTSVMLTEQSGEAVTPNRALADYQQQLMLLEEQNRKRLQVAKLEQEQSRAAQVRVIEVYSNAESQIDASDPEDRSSFLPIRRRRTHH